MKKKMCAMEETSNTLTLAAEERAKQGIHELEISFGGELDLHIHFHKCGKNPRHLKFIPVNIFEQHHLPKHRHSRKIAAWVRQISDLTVKLSVNYVSPNRPPGYPLSDRAGQRVLSVGSGFVTDISLAENNDKLPCPLKNCGLRSRNHEVCGYITIVTAAHVVFDDEEAENTTVEFFYDDSSDRSGVMIASGVRVAASSVEGDFCELLCVTHERKLFERLKCKLMCAKEETSYTVTSAAEERTIQIMQELEVSFGEDHDLHKNFDNYSKNPGHSDFIPVNKLEGCNFHKLCYWHTITKFEKITDFTVELHINYVSPNRPSGYPFSDRAGQRVPLVGRGFVTDFSLTENNDRLKCPLKNCSHRQGNHEVCGYITIVTAAHVVFDDEEAENTTVYIFYDGFLFDFITSGVRVVASSIEGDFCALLCVSHEHNSYLYELLKHEFISRGKKGEICHLFRTLLPGLESIQYESGLESLTFKPDASLKFLAKIRLSNPREAAKTLVALKIFTEDVIDDILTYWNGSNISLSDLLKNISFSKTNILDLIWSGQYMSPIIHHDKPAPYYDSGLKDLYSHICRNNDPINCQEAILSLISELGKHCSIYISDMQAAYDDSDDSYSLERASPTWDSSLWPDLNIHDVIDVSKGTATIEVTLFRKHIKYASHGSESKPDDMFLVHIAHPHGQSKQVTIGRQTDCFTGDGFYHQRYTAPTCPGSSGGPVWMIPASGDLSEVYGVPHSGCLGHQLNIGSSWTVYP